MPNGQFCTESLPYPIFVGVYHFSPFVWPTPSTVCPVQARESRQSESLEVLRANLKLSSAASSAIPRTSHASGANPSRNWRFSPGGQKGFLHGSRKCMNRMPRKFADLLVSRVYLLNTRGWSALRPTECAGRQVRRLPRCGCPRAWSSLHQFPPPKVIVPSDASETRSPLLPSNLYFITVLLS